MALLEKISEELINGNHAIVSRLTQEALDEGIAPAMILRDGLIVGMHEVGERFRRDEFFLPEVLVAAKAMQAAMTVLRPKLVETRARTSGTVVIGTIQGDLHDIGKNLVGMFFQGAGYNVIDLGVDVPPKRFVEAIANFKPHVVCLSALLTTTMSRMRDVIGLLVETGLRSNVKVLVGGAPVTEGFARHIGADGYSADAAGAVEEARILRS